MNNKITVSIDGVNTECEIILFFKWLKTKKYYLVYTDNKYDLDNNLKIYYNIYDDGNLLDVNTDEEINEIIKRLKGIYE